MNRANTLTLTPREVECYWALSALYSAEYETYETDEMSAETRNNLSIYLPRMDQKVREACK
jgi:hypothetical protein